MPCPQECPLFSEWKCTKEENSKLRKKVIELEARLSRKEIELIRSRSEIRERKDKEMLEIRNTEREVLRELVDRLYDERGVRVLSASLKKQIEKLAHDQAISNSYQQAILNTSRKNG